jgi:hypothetical protein
MRALLLPLLLGCLARASALSTRPLWMDEALQMRVSQSPTWFHEIGSRDLHPGLYALSLRAWSSVSDDVRWLRAPSLAASMAVIVAAAWAARRWRLPHPTAAAWLAALSPPLVRYAAEVRPYALGVLALTVAWGALAPRPRPATLAVSGGFAAAALWGAWPTLAVAAALSGRRAVRALAGVLAPLALLTFPFVLLPQLQHQAASLPSGFLAEQFPVAWNDAPSWLTLATLGALGSLATGMGGGLMGRATLAGLLLLAPTARAGWTRPRLGALTAASAATLAALALVEVHPWGATRHALVLLPAWLLLGSTFPRFSVPAALLGLALAPAPPDERVDEALRPGAPLRVDAGLADQVAWAAHEALPPDAELLPWEAAPPFTLPRGGALRWVHHATRCASCESVPARLREAGWRPQILVHDGAVWVETWRRE